MYNSQVIICRIAQIFIVYNYIFYIALLFNHEQHLQLFGFQFKVYHFSNEIRISNFSTT